MKYSATMYPANDVDKVIKQAKRITN